MFPPISPQIHKNQLLQQQTKHVIILNTYKVNAGAKITEIECINVLTKYRLGENYGLFPKIYVKDSPFIPSLSNVSTYQQGITKYAVYFRKREQ